MQAKTRKEWLHIAAVGFISSGFMANAMAQDLPHRKAGLWESSMESAQMQGKNMTSQQCIDEKTDAEMMNRALKADGKSNTCKQITSKRLTNGWEFDSQCAMTGYTMTSHAVITGDFNTQYTMQMHGHREPADKTGADTDVTMHAKFMGACPADMKPGDMKINGMLMHADGMPASMSKEQAEQIRKMMEQMKQARENQVQKK